MKTACVTGGSGYIASALVKMLLEKGYAVKTTVRDPDDTEKNSHLKDLQALGPLTVLRADLDDEGSFDDAVAGCDYVFLVAAPVNLVAEDQEKELVEPAVRGTLSVLRSCVKAGTVRRVIITSSAAGVYIRPDLQGDGHVLGDRGVLVRRRLPQSQQAADLGLALSAPIVVRPSVSLIRQQRLLTERCFAWDDDLGSSLQGYCVSKVLLEKAASRFATEHGVSVVTLCPVITVGAAPARKVRTSVIDSLSLLSGSEAGIAVLKFIEKTSGAVQMVHVRDLCRAELFVAEEAAAAGRYVCCSLNTTVLQLARFLAHKYPRYNVNTNLLSDDDQLLEKPRVCLSSAKLVREGFGFEHNTLDEIYDDVVEYGRELGILLD